MTNRQKDRHSEDRQIDREIDRQTSTHTERMTGSVGLASLQKLMLQRV